MLAATPDPLPGAVPPYAIAVWDASDAVLLVAGSDAAAWVLADAVFGKLACPVQDVPVPDASLFWRSPAPCWRLAPGVRDTPGVGRFAEQSCGAKARSVPPLEPARKLRAQLFLSSQPLVVAALLEMSPCEFEWRAVVRQPQPADAAGPRLCRQ